MKELKQIVVTKQEGEDKPKTFNIKKYYAKKRLKELLNVEKK
jgi:hypothetical protein